jgi:hypothetical protein
MRSFLAAAAALALILALGACGDDDATTTAAADLTTTTAEQVPEETSTTEAVTTTEGLPADAHPDWGVSWAEVFPAEGETALYQLVTHDQVAVQLPAYMEYGVEWRDGTWDRFVMGTPEPGNDGMAIYFERVEPWVIRVGGIEGFSASMPADPSMIETFAEPLLLEATQPLGEPYQVESEITIEGMGTPLVLGVTYEITVVAVDESVTVPFGTLDGCAHVEAAVGGAFIGGIWEVEAWFHPEQFLVSMTSMPTFDEVELVEGWS